MPLFVHTKIDKGLSVVSSGDCLRVIAEGRMMALSKLMAIPQADKCVGSLLRKHALVNTYIVVQ